MKFNIEIDTGNGDQFAETIDELSTIFNALYESDEGEAVSIEEPAGGIGEPASGIGSVIQDDEDYSQFNAQELAEDPLDPANNVVESGVDPLPILPGVELDGTGLPHDSRINTDSKAKRKSDDTWKLKRNLDTAFVEQVKAELRAAMGATVSEATPEPNAAAIFGGANAVTEQAAVTIPTPPGAVATPPQQAAIPTPPGVQEQAAVAETVAVDPFPAFITKISARVATPEIGTVYNSEVSKLLQKHSIAAIPLLINRKDLIPAIDLELDAIWNSLNTQG